MSITSYTTNPKKSPYMSIDNLNSDYSLSLYEQTKTANALDQRCMTCNSSGALSTFPPYYRLGPSQFPVCPYYNYTLPNVYPKIKSPHIDPLQYWYGPFDNQFCS